MIGIFHSPKDFWRRKQQFFFVLPDIKDTIPQLKDAIPELLFPKLKLKDAIPELLFPKLELKDAIPELLFPKLDLKDAIPELKNAIPQTALRLKNPFLSVNEAIPQDSKGENSEKEAI